MQPFSILSLVCTVLLILALCAKHVPLSKAMGSNSRSTSGHTPTLGIISSHRMQKNMQLAGWPHALRAQLSPGHHHIRNSYRCETRLDLGVLHESRQPDRLTLLKTSRASGYNFLSSLSKKTGDQVFSIE